MSFGLDQYFKEKKPAKKKKTETKKEDTIEVMEQDPSGARNWPVILEETVKSMVLYPHLLDYTRTSILPKRPTITAEELSIQLRVPLGVAIVLLDKLRSESKETQ
ncbi:MAG: hypothetical protein ACFFDU_10270 [Candidatus Thorarchaeota archaeon]